MNSRRWGSLLVLVLVAWLSAPARAASAETPCDSSRLGELLLGLFPPSAADVRAQSARQLGECRAARAVGVLATVVRSDDNLTVRTEAIRALGAIGTPEARKALQEVPAKSLPAPLRAEVRKALEPPAPPPGPVVQTPPKQEPPPANPPVVAGKLRETDAPETAFTPLPGTSAPKASPPAPPSPPIASLPPTPPSSRIERRPPPQVLEPVRAPQPEVPFDQQDGLVLSIATSAVAGGTLMPFLAAMADQKNPLTLTLTSSAGAIIGGGSAWGLSRFGSRPNLAQATWYTNVTAWGTLSGLSLYSGLFANSDLDPAVKDKALWGVLAGGETLGIVAGIWSSQRWKWTPREMVLANGFVLGSFMTYGGARLLGDHPIDITPPIAIATIPVMLGSAVAARYAEPTAADVHLVGASSLAAGWSGFLLSNSVFENTSDRQRVGGLLAGLGGGFLTSAGISAFTEVEPRRSWAALGFLVAGNGLGLGSTMVGHPLNDAGEPDGRGWMLGSVVGGVAMGSAAFAAWPYLELGDKAVPMSLAGLVYGSSTWGLALTAADKGERHPEDGPRFFGGMLAGGVAAGTAGLVASRWFHPDGWDQFVTASTTALGLSAGLGTVGLLQPLPEQKGWPDAVGVLGGSALGFATGAYLQHRLPLDRSDAAAGGLGILYGGLVGALLPTVGNSQWQRTGDEGSIDARMSWSGALLGIGLGGAGAAAARHAANATPGQVAVPSVAGLLGLGMGSGLGMMVMGRDTSQPARLGAVVGTTGLIGSSIVADRWLRLSDGLRPSAAGFGFLGAALGTGYGVLLADFPGDGIGRQYLGGALLGASAGTATGLVISRYEDLGSTTAWTVSIGTALGAMFGRGTTMVSVTSTEESAANIHRVDVATTLVGAALGTAGSALAERRTPMEGTDAYAAAVGGGYGFLIGALAPTLGERTWSLSSIDTRRGYGALMTGTSMGAIGGALARWTSRVPSTTVNWALVGGVDGLAAGLGVGLLMPRPEDAPDSSQAERIGIVAGTLAGLGVGTFAWPQMKLGPGDARFIRATTLISGWTGLWLPAVGQPSLTEGFASQRLGQRMAGGLLAGVGVASLGSSLMSPALELDEDLVDDASWMYLLWSGAGAGAGALFSTRDDTPITAMLGAGTAGLLLGGALHDRISFTKSQPLAIALGVEGAWLGGWASVLMGGSAEGLPVFEGISARQLVGGVGAGLFGGVGIAALLGEVVPMDANQAGLGVLGSTLTASVTGGFSMMYPPLQSRAGVGLMMGGSAAGFAAGVLMAPRIKLTDQARTASFLGAGLGAAEALSFTWAAEATEGQTYGGAGLVGGAVGATLGLATATLPQGTSNAPAAASFAAWGAWVGSFAGSLAFKDGSPEVHRVSLGGLIGANAGFLTGYALLRSNVISPRDIGWISLFGGAGTLLGAGVTALPSSQENPRPILAGLAIGPVVGMAAGAIIWPRIRGPITESPSESAPSTPGKPSASSGRDVVGKRASGLEQVFLVTDWQPVMGNLPVREGEKEAPMFFGVYGRIW